jgi:hypothetical protein
VVLLVLVLSAPLHQAPGSAAQSYRRVARVVYLWTESMVCWSSVEIDWSDFEEDHESCGSAMSLVVRLGEVFRASDFAARQCRDLGVVLLGPAPQALAFASDLPTMCP